MSQMIKNILDNSLSSRDATNQKWLKEFWPSATPGQFIDYETWHSYHNAAHSLALYICIKIQAKCDSKDSPPERNWFIDELAEIITEMATFHYASWENLKATLQYIEAHWKFGYLLEPSVRSRFPGKVF